MNNVCITGYLAEDPTSITDSNGHLVVNTKVWTKRPFKDKHGDYVSDIIPITFWRKQAEVIEDMGYCGELVEVTGRLQSREYDGGIEMVVVATNMRLLDQ